MEKRRGVSDMVGREGKEMKRVREGGREAEG